MHITIVNFQLNNLSVADYEALCDQVAPAFAEVPGLLSKVWLADPTRNTFGGVYTWTDEEAFATFLTSDLFQQVMTHPGFTNITSADFAIMEEPSRVTRGVAAAVA